MLRANPGRKDSCLWMPTGATVGAGEECRNEGVGVSEPSTRQEGLPFSVISLETHAGKQEPETAPEVPSKQTACPS